MSEVKDQGKYECVANNSVGTEYSKSTVLYVKGKQTWKKYIYIENFYIYHFSGF